MRTLLILFLFLLQGFDKRAYFQDLSSDDPMVIDRRLEQLATAGSSGKEAFEGALLMKRAGLDKDAKHRMDRFRSGRQKLEREIARDSGNAECRFLRLVIQEHVPKGVPYRANLDKDATMVIRDLDKLPAETREAVKRYAKNSARLKAAME
jgi:hypothetical protein